MEILALEPPCGVLNSPHRLIVHVLVSSHVLTPTRNPAAGVALTLALTLAPTLRQVLPAATAAVFRRTELSQAEWGAALSWALALHLQQQHRQGQGSHPDGICPGGIDEDNDAAAGGVAMPPAAQPHRSLLTTTDTMTTSSPATPTPHPSVIHALHPPPSSPPGPSSAHAVVPPTPAAEEAKALARNLQAAAAPAGVDAVVATRTHIPVSPPPPALDRHGMGSTPPSPYAALSSSSPGTVGLLLRLADAATDRLLQLDERRRRGVPILSPKVKRRMPAPLSP